MSNSELLQEVKQRAQVWLDGKYDARTKKEVKDLLENNESELIESFYRDLEFGTGGLRGIMGAGTNRMNIYTVGMATQGLANYAKKNFADLNELKVAIAYDCRNNSKLFAETAAKIFAGNGFKVFLFDELKPTPELSFAIRHFGCQTGIVITASHNPKEYNGFKAYWNDGGQVVPPHDKNIIAEVQKIQSVEEVMWDGDESKIEILGNDFDESYTEKIKELSLSPEVIERQKDLKIVYTPIHGTGVKLVPMVLHKMGFTNVNNVPEQDVVSGNFPTVHSPNPEETAALQMAIDKGKEIDADIIMGTDPDSDRVGIVVKDNKGEFVILNGNQTAAILLNYLIKKWKENGKLQGKEYVVYTIVTTELLGEIASKYDVEIFKTLTGFKWIADVIAKNEGEKLFIGGGEESYGYLAGEFVRDKDAIMSCALLAEAAAYAKDQDKSLFDFLLDIYQEFGFYKETLKSVVKKGKSGAEEIQLMMANFRENTPETLAGAKIVKTLDYQASIEKDLVSGSEKAIDMPKSNVLQFILEDETKVSMRPSGTEPKIKFYVSVKTALDSISDYESTNNQLDKTLDSIIKELSK
jgi:phosphoglucomutase